MLQEGGESGPSKDRILKQGRRKQLSDFTEGGLRRQCGRWVMREVDAEGYPVGTGPPNGHHYSHLATLGGMPAEGLQLLP